ncbi:MAG: phosphoesterase RecJ domain-containing protein [Candidatus Saganbacteria bacterium]|uniref:Phosphoesterase RecJ domain-containing protein n=1 Tax=Candidatus Saganbacteria bacterium TaxID=2575572 RepID=A0A833L185_UNCSA|nr:MAG: phosphoesterase RecJ domain-containing protein [Candidatus Saganbacteria bacterium]
MKNIIGEIKKLVLSSKTAIIASHIDPDGDTLGSMIGLAIILKRVGLDCVMYSQDGVPNTYKFLSHSDEVVNKAPKTEFDLLIAVDSSDISRIGEHKINAKKIINIDHHPDNTNFGDINFVELLSAVAEQIYHIAIEFGVKIDEEIAEALYVSIITDTGNFKYSNTLPSTFYVAGELVNAGANPFKLANQVYENQSVSSFKLLAKALESMEVVKNSKVAYSVITHQMIVDVQARGDDFVGIIDHLRSLKNVEVAVLFREEEREKYKINFRSKGSVNVSKIAKELGGGGHVKASGCIVSGRLEEVKNKVLNLLLPEIK